MGVREHHVGWSIGEAYEECKRCSTRSRQFLTHETELAIRNCSTGFVEPITHQRNADAALEGRLPRRLHDYELILGASSTTALEGGDARLWRFGESPDDRLDVG